MNIIMEKQINFLTIREAIREIIYSLLRSDCIEEVAKINSFLEGGQSKEKQRLLPIIKTSHV